MSLAKARDVFFRQRRIILGHREPPPQHKGELLQGGDDDLGAIDQGIGQLPRILIDGFDHTLSMFDLADGILELPVQDPPVGDDTQSKTFRSLVSRKLASRCESQDMPLVLPLPAECWIR